MDKNLPGPVGVYGQNAEEVLKQLSSKQSSGLTQKQVEERTDKFGKNILPQSKGTSPLKIFLSQFKSTIVAILVVAIIISYLYEHFLDVYIIAGIIIINAIVGFVQEYQAEKSIEALKSLLIPQAKVRRDGKVQTVSSHELVPGDIVIVGEGDNVPADARLLQTKDLQADESSLTGESLPVEKTSEKLGADVPMAEQKNMLWMGTLVVGGEAEAVVVNTGARTILGKIAKDLSEVLTEDDHFKKKTNQLGRQMGMIAIGSTGLIFAVGFLVRNFALEEILMFSVASLVSALPEGLPVILTVILALSAKRMASRKAIVRRLSATETLAVVDTIVTDKTGTLTQNKMSVNEIRLPYQPAVVVTYEDNRAEFRQDANVPTQEHMPLQKLLDIAGSCHKVIREYDADGKEKFSGDPTEVAVVTLADRAINSPSYYQRKIQQTYDLPFSQQHRWRVSLVDYLKTNLNEMFVIGSPEMVLERCSKVLLPDHVAHIMDEERRREVQSQVDELTATGARVLALTYRPTKGMKQVTHEDVGEMIFVGLIGIVDPPYPETKKAIEDAHQAGIRVIMATGDHPLTAKTIGLELGIIDPDKDSQEVLTEKELAGMSDEELSKKLEEVKIFARMTPAAKLRLAAVLQQKGKVVAMTGDGVNDAPALKQADIGLGMGKKGTDVAREASDIVLADDNFATIIVAIEEGRTQLRNVRRTTFFYITTNIAESATLLLFLMVGLPLPLLPKQILWLNLVTGGITDVALATEPIHDGVLKAGPYAKGESIINKVHLPFLALITGTIVICATVFFLIYQPQGLERARTMLFLVLSMSQIYNMYNMRSLRRSIFSLGIFTSRNVNIAFLVSVMLMLAVTSLPAMTELFEFELMRPIDILWVVMTTLVIVLVSEGYKKIRHGTIEQRI